MVRTVLATVFLSAGVAFAAGPRPGQIKNLVTFGDSYTDVVSTQSPRPSEASTHRHLRRDRMRTQTVG